MKKTDRRVEKTELSIRQALFELLEEKDIRKISVTELAAKANIDRKTFYLHYDSVYGIIEEYQREVYKKVQSMLKQTKVCDIRSLFQGFSKIMTEDITLYRYIATKQNLRYLQYEWKEILKSCLVNIYESSSELPSMQFLIYTEFIASGIIGMYIDWLICDKGLSLEEFTDYGIRAVEQSWNDCLNLQDRGN